MKPARPQELPLKCIAWSEHLQQMGIANRALARYSAMLDRLPNPELLLSPLTVQEAVLSSRIEGTFATMSEVLQADAGVEPEEPSRRLDIEEINRYRQVLSMAEESIRKRPSGLRLLLEMHSILLASTRGANKRPGHIRREQNYIGSRVGGVEVIRFVPPTWQELPKAITNWENYYHADEPDPIIQLGIVHAQFEFLHPFLDGNGRLGRVLIPLFLFEKGLLKRPMFYLSEQFEVHRDEYVQTLNGLGTKRGWNAWCRFFLKAIAEQATSNARKAESIFALYEEMKNNFVGMRSPYAIPLLDALFRQPAFRLGQLALVGGTPSRVTMSNLVSALVKRNVLQITRQASGSAATVFQFTRLIEIAESR